jgi:hypothetical protein
MPRVNIDQLRSIGNVAVPYRWNLDFSSLPTGLNVDSSALNLRCESSDLPKLSSAGKIEVNIRGNKVLQQGIMNYSNTLNLVFYETEDSVVHQFVKDWRELCWKTKTGAQVAKADYEAVVLLTRLNHADEPIWEYKLVGCFLEDFDLGNLDGATSDSMRTTLILSFDYYEDRKL